MRALVGHDRLRDRVAGVGGVEHDRREPVVLGVPEPAAARELVQQVDRVVGAVERERALGQRGRGADIERGAVDGVQAVARDVAAARAVGPEAEVEHVARRRWRAPIAL